MASSTITQPTSGVDRKAIKKPDDFMSALGRLFDAMAKNSRSVMVMGGILVAVAGAGALYLNMQETKAEKGRNALYIAQKSVIEGMKAAAPKPVADAKVDPKADPKAAKKPAEPNVDAVAFKKMDIDAQLADGVSKLKAVAQDFSGTRPGYEARIQLANLYFDHGSAANAVEWYQKAADGAPGVFEKALALSSLGYAHENAGKFAEAVQAYEKALNLGEGSIKGDLLLGVARSHEALHDTAKAKNTYDQIISQLPNTEFSKTAELQKSKLE